MDGSGIDAVASWADDYRRDHPETGPWHYIDIPLADSKIDLTKECPKGECVVAKTEQFLAVLKDPNSDWAAEATALKYVVHFIGDRRLTKNANRLLGLLNAKGVAIEIRHGLVFRGDAAD